MANKLIMKSVLKHYNEQPVDSRGLPIAEPDKTKSISELSGKELREMIDRVGSERHLQSIIRDMKRNSGERDTYENPLKVDTKTPINQLYHHGIPKQRWGFRRFQNEDGSLTPAGRARYGRGSEKTNSKGGDADPRASTNGLSNAELRKRNERLQLEETYRKLTAPQIAEAESWVKKSLTKASEQALTEFSKGVILGSAKLLVKELSPSLAEAGFSVKEQTPKKKG